jgi:hypothetical protein
MIEVAPEASLEPMSFDLAWANGEEARFALVARLQHVPIPLFFGEVRTGARRGGRQRFRYAEPLSASPNGSVYEERVFELEKLSCED